MEGGFADDVTPWGRLNAWYVVAAEPWDWPGPLVGTMSIKGSVFLNVNYAIAAFNLGSSRVTIGGSPFTGNRFEDAETAVALVQLDGSSSEISHNDIIRTNWYGIGLEQASFGPTETASKFTVQHNNITVVPTYLTESGWLPDAIDFYDWNWDDLTSVKSEFIISDNTIQLVHNTGSGIIGVQDAGSIISNNQISGIGFAGLGLFGSTKDLLLGNNVARFTPEDAGYGTFAPIWLGEDTNQNTVVGGNNAANAVDLGTDNTLVGVSNMHGNLPGPAIRNAMKRKMEIIKSMRKP